MPMGVRGHLVAQNKIRGFAISLDECALRFSEMIPEMPTVIRYPSHSLSPDQAIRVNVGQRVRG